jgi:hypothetical protein
MQSTEDKTLISSTSRKILSRLIESGHIDGYNERDGEVRIYPTIRFDNPCSVLRSPLHVACWIDGFVQALRVAEDARNSRSS